MEAVHTVPGAGQKCEPIIFMFSGDRISCFSPLPHPTPAQPWEIPLPGTLYSQLQAWGFQDSQG